MIAHMYLRMETNILEVLFRAPLLSKRMDIPGSCMEMYLIVKAWASVFLPSKVRPLCSQHTKNSPLDHNHLSVDNTHTRHR